jgi:DNA polymerase III epsilon subunit-like protein
MPEYFKLRSGLSRGIEDGASQKKVCTYKVEYFLHDAGGMVASVSEYDDGFIYRSPAARVSVLPGAVPCSEAEYDAALARCLAVEKKRREEARKEAEFTKSLRKGMALNAHASYEAGAAELLEGLAHEPTFLAEFTVFDVETTGFSADKDRLLEVAAVRYENWQPVGQMQQLVRFMGQVPYHITNLTGLTSADVRYAAEPKVVLNEFRKLAGDSVLVGHNVSFDLRMIEAERKRLGAVAPLPNTSLCTKIIAQSRYPAPHKLGELCQRFGIPVVGAHRAMNDVVMTFELLRYLHQQQPLTPSLVGAPAAAKPKKAVVQSSLFAA